MADFLLFTLPKPTIRSISPSLRERPGPACPVRCIRTFIDARRSQGPLAPETLLFGSLIHGNVTGERHSRPCGLQRHNAPHHLDRKCLAPGGVFVPLRLPHRQRHRGCSPRGSCPGHDPGHGTLALGRGPRLPPAPRHHRARLVRPLPSYLWFPAPLDRFPYLSSCTPLLALLRLKRSDKCF